MKKLSWLLVLAMVVSLFAMTASAEGDYTQAPMLDAAVEAGELPPVAERLSLIPIWCIAGIWPVPGPLPRKRRRGRRRKPGFPAPRKSPAGSPENRGRNAAPIGTCLLYTSRLCKILTR